MNTTNRFEDKYVDQNLFFNNYFNEEERNLILNDPEYFKIFDENFEDCDFLKNKKLIEILK